MIWEFTDTQVLWGVAIWRVLLTVLLIFVGFLSRRLIIAFFKGFLLRKAEETQAEWDDELVKFTPRTPSRMRF